MKATTLHRSDFVQQNVANTKTNTVDGSLDEVLSTTTIGKADMGQKGGRHSLLEGEWTHLVGEGTYA
jgi:hypothetical protein